MYPTLFRVGPWAVPTHEVFVALGVVVALVLFGLESRRRGVGDRAMWTIAAGALLGGAVLAKTSTAWRYVADTDDPSLGGILLYGGKSVVGGLAGAYLGAVLTKRILRYPFKTGDVFAPAVALGIGVGRVGCFLTEQIGISTSMPWGITPPADIAPRIPNCPQCLDGVPLHPSFLYEIAFCFGAFVVLRVLRDRIPVPGELFKLFLLGYGLFRFGVEFVRGNPEMMFGLTGSQIFLAATMPILIGYFVLQILSGAYHRAAPAEAAARSFGAFEAREAAAFCPACQEERKPLDSVHAVPARFVVEENVWLERTCPDHGTVTTLYDEDPEILAYLERWRAPTKPPTPDDPTNDDPLPSGYRRGLGAAQIQHTCILLEDVTNACNLNCPTCYAASSPDEAAFASVADVVANVDRRLELEGGRLDVVMVSGGEPTLHPGLAELLDCLQERDIVRILLNTNGLVLARDDSLLSYLEAHRDRIELYLQFDGFRPATWRHHRGADLSALKLRTVQRVSDAGVFTTLVMTAALDVNDDEIGAVVQLALDTPFIGGVCIQPVFGSGRSAGIDPNRRLTHTGVLRRLGPQTGGEVSWDDLIGLPCSHPHCASVGYMLRTDDGEWRSIVKLIGHEQLAEHLELVSNRIVDPAINAELKILVRDSLRSMFSNRTSLADDGFRDLFAGICSVCDLRIGQLIHRAATLSRNQEELRQLLATRVKRIQVKPFMDVNTMLLERLLQCCVHVGTQSTSRHQCVPFCAAQAWPELSAMKVGAEGAWAPLGVPVQR